MSRIKQHKHSLVAAALARLIEESPSVKAAMKAGKKTNMSVRIYREKTGRWDDYGIVSSLGSEGWGSWLKGKLGLTKLIYKVEGNTVDETTL
jgi:hypothetical protein